MPFRKRVHLYLLLAVLLTLGAACRKAVSDSDLSSQVQSKFQDDSGLQDKQIAVAANEGVVTLSGKVENDAERTAAARYASSVSGIKQVVNNLEIAPPRTHARNSPPPVPAKPAKNETKAKAAPGKPAQRRTSERATVAAATLPAPINQSEQSPAPAAPAPAQVAVPATPVPLAPPPPAKKVTIPPGTTLTIRLVDAIDSETAEAGQSFKATLDAPLSVDGNVAIPAGYDVQGHVVDVQSAGKFAGKSLLVLQLDQIHAGGRSYGIQTDEYRREGSSRGKNTAKKVGAGAAIGAIIGGIAGGGKGAAIGGAAGAGVGGGVQAATKGQQIKLPSESVLSFSLQSSLTVTAVAEGPNAGRPKLDAAQSQPQN